MPRWEVHLSISSMALVVIITGAILGLYQSGPSRDVMISSFTMFKTLILGSVGMILGSVLPDVDGKGKIRWTIAPILGAYAITPPFIGHTTGGRLMDGLRFLYNDGSRLFLLITLVTTLILFLPMKHRGLMHSGKTGMVFGVIFGSYALVTASLPLFGGFIVCVMAILGYFWHLSLDGEVSL